NNTAERAHRFGVLWRKRGQGTSSEQGNRRVERILSLRHTCRIRGRPTFPLLVEAVSCLFNGEKPDLYWLTPPASLPLASTPSADTLEALNIRVTWVPGVEIKIDGSIPIDAIVSDVLKRTGSLPNMAPGICVG